MLTVLALCLAAMERPSGAWIYIAIGALAGVSVGIRTVGIALAAGVCCAFAWKRAFRASLTIAASAGLVALLVSRPTLFHRSMPSLLAQSGDPGWDQVVAYYTSYTQFHWKMGIPSLPALVQLVRLNLLTWLLSPGLILISAAGKVAGYVAALASLPTWI